MLLRTSLLTGAAAAALVGASLGGAAAAQPATVVGAASAAPSFEGAQGTFVGVSPQRLLDTRTGNGAPKGLVGAGKEVSLLVTGRGGVPGGVSAVVLNLAAVAPSTNTFLTAYPSGTTRPATSNLNVAARGNRANMVTVPVGADGRVRIYNSTGTVHILADVTGYYHGQAMPSGGPGSTYAPIEPERIFDSRSDGGVLASGDEVTIWLEFGPYANDIAALATNVTVLGGSRPGFLSAGAAFTDAPASFSTINYGQNQVIANMSVGASGLSGTEVGFSVKNGGLGTVHAIVDVVGYYVKGDDQGLRFRPLAPTRIIDTRSGVGGPAKPLGANEARLHTAPESVATIDTWALAANTTIASPTAATYVTVYDADTAKPAVSNLNAARGETAANSTFVPLSIDTQFRVHNAAGSAPVIMDVFGSFDLPAEQPPAPTSAPRISGSDRSAPTAPAPVGLRVTRD
ncbi:hypothetical protein ACOCJ5_04785 [Knoellia sp. CPCC 206450]|uniref:hypothetical protein n=1 Tax=Knoellia tibetensis TaxID=3404798 RepID=UPI003B42FDAE